MWTKVQKALTSVNCCGRVGLGGGAPKSRSNEEPGIWVGLLFFSFWRLQVFKGNFKKTVQIENTKISCLLLNHPNHLYTIIHRHKTLTWSRGLVGLPRSGAARGGWTDLAKLDVGGKPENVGKFMLGIMVCYGCKWCYHCYDIGNHIWRDPLFLSM